MSDRTGQLLRSIQDGALDSATPLADVLRKCVALGGATQSRDLVEWASSELNGYKGTNVPEYRVIPAPLMIDAIVGSNQISRQIVSSTSLPKNIRDGIREEVPLAQGIGALEVIMSRTNETSISFSPPGMADILVIWNHELNNNDYQKITSLYWTVDISQVSGIVDKVRNKLISLIAEFEIEFEATKSTIDAVNHAVQVTMGDGGNVSIISSSGEKSRNNLHTSNQVNPLDTPKWRIGGILWSAIVGVATITATWFGYLALTR